MTPAGNDVKSLLLNRLGKHVSGLGWQPKPSRQAFVRKTEAGLATFHLSFIAHPDDIDVTADIAVRLDAVEELVSSVEGRPLSGTKDRSTLGTDLGNLADGRQKRWTIRDSESVDAVAADIFREFQAFGVPYVERFSTLQAALEVLSRDDPSGWLHSPLPGARCLRAVAAASLLGEIDRGIEIAARCDATLSSKRDPSLTAFRSLVSRALRQK